MKSGASSTTTPSTLEILIKSSIIINNGVMWLNADGHILGINDKLTEELGYQNGAYFPKTIFEVNPNTSFLSWKKIWKQALVTRTFLTKTEQLTSDNTIYPINMRGVLLNIDKQEICMVVTENLMNSNRYKDLLDVTSEIVNIGSWEWDLVQNEIIFSNQLYTILQIPKSKELNRSSILELFETTMTTNAYNKIKSAINDVLKSGGEYETEINLDINGLHETYILSMQSVFLQGKSIKLYGTLQNLSKINKQVSGLYFTQYVMDNARDMILWTDENNKFVYANEAVCSTLGYKKDEIIGQDAKLISPNYEKNIPILRKQMDEKKLGELKTIHRKKDGTILPVLISANYIEFEGKRFNCAFIKDMTNDNKRNTSFKIIEQSLNLSRDLFCSILEDGSFRYCNDTFKEITGYSDKEIKDLKILDIVNGSSLEIIKKGWDQMKNGVKLHNLRREIKTKDGNIIPVEMFVDLVNVDGVYYSTNTMRDLRVKIEKEKQRQLYLKQIEELQKNTADQNIALREEIDKEFNFGNIISRDPNYKKVLQQIDQVAETSATVLILGETGTGKELVARAIHQSSERSNLPMVKVNCGALPENLIESELFGHEKGAFTGAIQRKIGKFERANKGTIFLDEIGELPLDLQSKLLRVLQEGEIERVGGSELLQLDVRVIAATNRNLIEQVNSGKFREDLYYRLNVFPIHNLALRDRPEDIPILAEYFVKKHSSQIGKNITKISSKSLNTLMKYNFLGNVRELENIIERAVIICKGRTLSIENNLVSKVKSEKQKTFLSLENAIKEHIIKALKKTNGKVSGTNGAAEILGMNSKTLTSKLNKLGISKNEFIKN